MLPGLEDLKQGRSNTVGTLLIAIAFTRLTNTGLAISKAALIPEPELTLYARLEDKRADAYSDNALLTSLNSFCNALKLRSWLNRSKQLDALEPTANP